MTRRDDTTRILISEEAAQRLARVVSRRTFLAMTGGVAAAAALAACGSDEKSSDSSSSGSDTSSAESTASPSTGDSSTGGDFDKTINMYTWAEYDDLDLLKSWGDIKLTIFNSNEEAIQKLVQGGGSSGFDMVVPTGAYIPQLVAAGLLKEIDKTRIPNFSNLDAAYINQSWDPDNKHSVCKNWGSTGWIYDTTVVTTEIKTWSDFIAAAQGEASGLTSILDTAPNLCGMYFWANGIPWTTEKKADLDACEDFLVNEFASHIKAFDSYPGINLTAGSYALSMVWNGDARQGLIGVEESGGDTNQYKWGLGAPETELWMDNWCILEEAKNVDAAYDFINFILDPANSVKDLQFHGYNTGIKGVEELTGDVPFKDMIFFTPDEVARLRAGTVNSGQDRLVEIYSNVKAKAGG
ncbi:MAG: spermidine/putrescine ABC transporter substrate-binding protein [Ilumatobacteraceae bacterium]